MTPTSSVVAAFLAAGLWIAAPAAAQTQPIGYVKVAQGEIRVMRGGAPELLRVGDPVYSRDRIVTLDNQAIGITLYDNSRVSAGQNTVLVMQEGNGVRQILKEKILPIRSIIIGIVDAVEVGE